MGIQRQQVQVNLDFNKREVDFFARKPLDLKPTHMRVPFAVVKGVLSQILKSEAEDELSVLLGLGDVAAEPADPKPLDSPAVVIEKVGD